MAVDREFLLTGATETPSDSETAREEDVHDSQEADIECMVNSHYGMKGLRTNTTVILFESVK